MKQLFSLIVAVLSIVVLAVFVMKIGQPVLFELAVLMLLIVLLFLSFTTKQNRMMMLMLYGLSLVNMAFVYISYPQYRLDDLYLIGILSIIGFFFELGREEVIRIPPKERAKLMRKWGMQKIQPIAVEEELESAKELQEELKRSKEEIKKEIRDSKSQSKKENRKAKEELKKEIKKTKSDLKKELKKAKRPSRKKK